MGQTIHLRTPATAPTADQWEALDALGIIYDGDDGDVWGERPTGSLHLQWQVDRRATRRDALAVASAVRALGLPVDAVTITDTAVWSEHQRVIV